MQTITLGGVDRQYVQINVSIRRADDEIVQTVGNYTVFLNIENLSP